MSKLSIVLQNETYLPLMLMQQNNSGVITRVFLSEIFQDSTTEEAMTLLKGSVVKNWNKKKGAKDINIDEVFGKTGIIEKMGLKEIDSSFVSSVNCNSSNKYIDLKKIVWKGKQ